MQGWWEVEIGVIEAGAGGWGGVWFENSKHRGGGGAGLADYVGGDR